MSGRLALTPSQTVGPFFGTALAWSGGATLVSPETLGERIELRGRVLDGDGEPVTDALVELWQANAAGRYAHPDDRRTELLVDPAFLGFGRCATDADGRYWFSTIRPGRVPANGPGLQAPHLVLGVFARGLLRRLETRAYFEGSSENGADPTLKLVDPARVARLMARREPGDAVAYRFDIVLQGPGETVFFTF